ncbi:SAP domain-containing protein [Artemisia annua]|uniref:SAP domain-containing protein n=1 Tax=Artemisia annua TaxID=35608 RepID=A0A2U1MYQ2_ARTAN|nr:SAP domain-containing protein [Artemisia annua]
MVMRLPGENDYDVIEVMESDDEDIPSDDVPRGGDIQGGNDSNEMSTYEIKSYLRKHGMRVSGTKEELMERIKEHERLKDGGGESLYPISSFSINCTGDACKGDVVMFRQNIMKGIKVVGRRTVAGRIVTESYGASHQQHTFTVEVLWSKRSKKLNPLSILLVKGRYLYKYGTFRQPWESEAERLKVLGEKHRRGDAARHKRKLRQTGFASNNNKGRKCQKVYDKGPCKSKQPTQIGKQKSQPTQRDKQASAKRKGKTHVKESTSSNKKKVVPALFQKMKFQRSTRLTFHPDPNLNPTRYRISDHHQQEASSSFPNDRTLVPYGHQNNGQSVANHVFHQPPGYHHHIYQQPIPRFKSIYPISSFSVDCTGDACKGDVVLFKQGVYKRKKILWKQGTIVGRIVKEIYSAPKRRHDFTIEVLWTKGALHLRPLSVVVVKDWNVYRFGTLRQPWENEAERSKVLREKHRQAEAANKNKRKFRKTDITSSNNAGIKRQKVSRKGPSQSIQPTQKDKRKSSKERAAAFVIERVKAHKRKAMRFEKTELKKSTEPTFCPDLNPNLNSNPDSNLKPKANLNVNPNPNINSNPTPNVNPKPNSNSSLNQKEKPKPKPNPTEKPKPSPTQKPNLTPNPNPKQKPKPNQKREPKLKATSNPYPCMNSNSNPYPYPYPNFNIYSYHHRQEASSFFPHDRTLLSNFPPHGFPPNLPPLGFPHNQPTFGLMPNQPPHGYIHNLPPYEFSGFGGQWGPNHVFYQPPNHVFPIIAAANCWGSFLQ